MGEDLSGVGLASGFHHLIIRSALWLLNNHRVPVTSFSFIANFPIVETVVVSEDSFCKDATSYGVTFGGFPLCYVDPVGGVLAAWGVPVS